MFVIPFQIAPFEKIFKLVFGPFGNEKNPRQETL
jgi:hypothetical protein